MAEQIRLMETAVTIRPAVLEDAEKIRQIMDFFIRETTYSWRYNAMDLDEIKSWLKKHAAKRVQKVIVADYKGSVIGYGCLSDFREPEGYWPCVEDSIYILPGYEGQGIGSRIMEQLIQMAIFEKLQTIIAAIDSTNQKSIQFHQRFGFEHSGYLKRVGWKQNKWLDLVFMTCDLNQARFDVLRETDSQLKWQNE